MCAMSNHAHCGANTCLGSTSEDGWPLVSEKNCRILSRRDSGPPAVLGRLVDIRDK